MPTNNMARPLPREGQKDYAFSLKVKQVPGFKLGAVFSYLVLVFLGIVPPLGAQNLLSIPGDSTLKEFYFASPGVLYPKEGDSLQGIIHFSFLEGNVHLSRTNNKGKRRTETFKPKSLHSFHLDSLDGLYFEVVKVKATLGSKEVICQNLTPGVYGLVKLYRQFITQGLLTLAVDGKVLGNWEYSVLLPGEEKVMNLQELKLNPMHKKLPAYLSDCPILADKVARQEEGYTFQGNVFQISQSLRQAQAEGASSQDELRLSIYMRIAEEYNTCQ